MAAALVLPGCGHGFRRSTIPGALTDGEYWQLIEDVSEEAGTFAHSDNLVSN